MENRLNSEVWKLGKERNEKGGKKEGSQGLVIVVLSALLCYF